MTLVRSGVYHLFSPFTCESLTRQYLHLRALSPFESIAISRRLRPNLCVVDFAQ